MHPGPQSDRPCRFRNGYLLAGRFRIVGSLGVGGMGEVYQAYDQELKEAVALKLIRSDLALEPRRVNRFKQEIRNARRVSHPNVCRVYDLFQVPDRGSTVTFLTMEFVQGETLFNRLRRETRLSPEVALPIIRQICAGLSAAHQQGIIHRDLKPGNVLLAEGANSRAVISDFGLAFDTAPLTEHESTLTIRDGALGTPAYMAPEQIEGAPVTPATDIYALGLVIYEMVTGQRPFTGATPLSEAAKRLTEAPPPPDVHTPDLPDRWKLTILRCLVRDSARRFQSADEVMAALEGRSRVSPIPETATRRKWIWGALAATAIIVAAALLLWPKGTRLLPETQQLYDEGVAALRDGTYFKALRRFQAAVSKEPEQPLLHARLAEAWNEMDAPDKARDAMLRASVGGAAPRNLSDREAVYMRAVSQTVQRDFPKATETYRHALKIAPQTEKAPAHIDLGRALERQGRSEDALREYVAAAKLSPRYGAAFVRQAFIHQQQRNRKAHAEALARAEEIFENNLEGLTEVHYQRAVLATELGQLDTARSELEAALRLARTAHNPHQEARTLLLMGRAAMFGNQPTQAQGHYTSAFTVLENEGLKYIVPSALIERGILFARRGRFDEAFQDLTQAVDLAHKNEDPARENLALLSLGQVNLRRNAVDDGVRQIEQAVAFLRQNGYRRDAGIGLIALSRYRRDRGEYEAALKMLEEQRSIADQEDDVRGKGSALEAMSVTHLRRDQFARAVDCARQASQAGKLLNDAQLQYSGMLREADARWRMGQYELATQLIDEAAKSYPRLLAEADRIRAEIALSRGGLGEAAVLAERYLKNTDRGSLESEVRVRAVLARALARRGDARRAQQEVSEARRRSESITDPFARASDAVSCAEALVAAGDTATARSLLLAAIPLVDEVHKSESRVRGHLLLAQLDAPRADSHRHAATDAWDDLARTLGRESMASFAARPDIAPLRKAIESFATK